MKILYYQKISSTQDLAREYAQAGQGGDATFISNQQTAAYGKKGRLFYSPANTGIYMSMALPNFKLDMAKANLLTPFIAVEVVEVLQEFFKNKDFKIKWVNDIYLKEKKVAGILTEMQNNALIIGLGLNLTTTNFPADLQKKAGSITSDEVDKKKLVSKLIEALLTASKQYNKADFLSSYRNLSILLNKIVTLKIGKKQVVGVVEGFDQHGIILNINEEKVSFSAGEVEKVNF